MRILINVLAGFAATAVALVVLAVLAASLEAGVRLIGRRRRRRRVRGRPVSKPSRSLALLVDLDEASGLLRPSVQISGPPPVRAAFVRVELVEGQGTMRLTLGRSFPPGGAGTELPLPAFAPPPDLTPAEVLRWRWDVVLEDSGGELARWEEHPALAGGVNPEGELGIAVREHQA